MGGPAGFPRPSLALARTLPAREARELGAKKVPFGGPLGVLDPNTAGIDHPVLPLSPPWDICRAPQAWCPALGLAASCCCHVNPVTLLWLEAVLREPQYIPTPILPPLLYISFWTW